jgi:hypothetical protein
LSKLKNTGQLNGAESSVLNDIFTQLSGMTPRVREKVDAIAPINEVASPELGKTHKLAPLALAVAEMLLDEFGQKVSYRFEEKLDWLSALPNKNELAPVWVDICRVYSVVVDGAFSLDDLLASHATELRRGQQRVDIWFDAPYSFALEYDEVQHFNQFRLRTFENFTRYVEFPIDVESYRAECLQRHVHPGISGFTKLKTYDPLFPPMLAGDKQDNRVRQRAFKDFLKDIVPSIRPGVSNTWRVGAYVAGWKRNGFTEKDCRTVCDHLRQIGAVDSLGRNFKPR